MAARTPEPAVTGHPVAGTANRVRRRIPADLDLWVPGVVFGLIAFACFVLPAIPSIPGPNDGSLSEALRPPFSPGTYSAPTRWATTSCRGCSTAGNSR